jgi:hypothetical protein
MLALVRGCDQTARTEAEADKSDPTFAKRDSWLVQIAVHRSLHDPVSAVPTVDRRGQKRRPATFVADAYSFVTQVGLNCKPLFAEKLEIRGIDS